MRCFVMQQKLHSVRSTGTATGILMSPDLPFLRVKVWLVRLTAPKVLHDSATLIITVTKEIFVVSASHNTNYSISVYGKGRQPR